MLTNISVQNAFAWSNQLKGAAILGSRVVDLYPLLLLIATLLLILFVISRCDDVLEFLFSCVLVLVLAACDAA